MLVDTEVDMFQVSLPMLAAIAVFSALLLALTARMFMRMRHAKLVSGLQTLIGQAGESLQSFASQHELDEMLASRDKLNQDIQRIFDEQTDSWGIKVTNVELKHVDLNENTIRAMARQAEAERERRSKVIHATGELEASESLVLATQALAREPQAIQLRYLQTASISGDGKSTIAFPLPMDLLSGFIRK